MPNFDLVMESDSGTFKPWGMQFTGSESAMAIMKSIGSLLSPINASLVTTVIKALAAMQQS